MIKLFTLNIDKSILNKFNDIEIHSYYCDNCNSVAFIYVDNTMKYLINNPDYDRISSYIVKLR